ncbi:MAG: hypothetical protein WCK02_12475 [Bacteroidota bacterium]
MDIIKQREEIIRQINQLNDESLIKLAHSFMSFLQKKQMEHVLNNSNELNEGAVEYGNSINSKSDLDSFLLSIENEIDKFQTKLLNRKRIKTDWWDDLSASEKEAIENGINQIENGKWVSNEDVECKVNKLLGKNE